MALRRPKQLFPKNKLMNMTIENTFTCVVDGDIVNYYRNFIYNAEDNIELWKNPTVVTLPSLVDTGETLEMPIPDSVTTGLDTNLNQELYWVVEYSKDNITFLRSDEAFFKYIEDPILTTDLGATVSSQKVTVTGTYSQGENFPYEYWYYELRDVSDELLIRTDNNPSTKISYEFTGLETGQTYKLKLFTQLEFETVYQSIEYSFDVTFATPDILTKPEVVQNNERTSADISWGALVQIEAIINSGSGAYSDDFMIAGNTGYDIVPGTEIEYNNLNIQASFSGGGVRQFSSSSYHGEIQDFINTTNGDVYRIGRDVSNGWFYKVINGVIEVGIPYPIITTLVYGYVFVKSVLYIGVFQNVGVDDWELIKEIVI